MAGRIALSIPEGVAELAAEIVKVRTARHGGMKPPVADVYREALVRGLPLVLVAERGEVVPTVIAPSRSLKTTRSRALARR